MYNTISILHHSTVQYTKFIALQCSTIMYSIINVLYFNAIGKQYNKHITLQCYTVKYTKSPLYKLFTVNCALQYKVKIYL